jgi:plastocyanin
MRRIPCVVTALAAGLACASPAMAADQPIAFANYSYTPPDVTITVNDSATFSGTFADHPLAWDGGQYATTDTGSSKQFTFATPGVYSYHCQLHAVSHGMRGVIRVVAATPSPIPTPTPMPTPTPVPTPSGGASTDRTAPKASKVSLKGLTLTFRTSERATGKATLRRGGKTLAKGSAKAGATSIHFKLTTAGRKALRRGHRVKVTLALTLRDASGNAATVKRTVTVRRT